MYLPANLNLKNKKLLFIGGGKVCIHKIIAVKQFTSDITILSEEFLQEVKDLGFTCIQKKYEAQDLDGFSIIFACTNNREVNKQIKVDVEKAGKLVNVADDPELCDFISPAIFKEGNFTISVSSGATDTLKAIKIRNEIKEKYAGKLACIDPAKCKWSAKTQSCPDC